MKNKAKELLEKMGDPDASDERVLTMALTILIGNLVKLAPRHGKTCPAAVGGVCLLFNKPAGEICLSCPVRGVVEVEKPVPAEEIFG